MPQHTRRRTENKTPLPLIHLRQQHSEHIRQRSLDPLRHSQYPTGQHPYQTMELFSGGSQGLCVIEFCPVSSGEAED
ncbi:hypothetical protein GCM10018966_077890 [Streptomyces yanii]